MTGILSALIIGILAGFLAGKLVKGRGFGILGNIVVGVIGAFVGGFLFTLIGLTATGLLAKIVQATCGAVALLFIVGLIKRA